MIDQKEDLIIITKCRPIGGAQRVAISQSKALDIKVIFYFGLKTDFLSNVSFKPVLSFDFLKAIFSAVRIHTHSTLAGWLGRLLGNLSNKRVYHTFHGFNSENGKNGLLYKRIERLFSFFNFDAVFVCSSDLSRAIDHGYVKPTHRKNVIYNPSISAVLYKERTITDSENLRLISIARCSSQKDFKTLSKALLEVSNVYVDNYGGGAINEYSESFGHSQLVFKGEVDNLAELIGSYDAGILISNDEGFPVSVLEMLSVDLPVIVSDVGGCSEIFDLGIDGYLVERHSVKGVVEALNALKNDKNRTDRTGINADIWKNNFSEKQYKQKYTEIIKL